MRDRNVRVGMVALILAMPWLCGVIDPAAWGISPSRFGSIVLTDLALVAGLWWAGRARRALLTSRVQAERLGGAVVLPGPAESALVPVSVPSSRPSTVAPAI